YHSGNAPVGSPPGASTLMTVAPMRSKRRAARGPGRFGAMVMTRMPHNVVRDSSIGLLTYALNSTCIFYTVLRSQCVMDFTRQDSWCVRLNPRVKVPLM